VAYSCRVLADSLSPYDVRLTTLEVTFPRIVLAEVNTHRALSRCSASSRAIPVAKRIEQVEADPFIPEAFGRNKAGMQSGGELDDSESRVARDVWIESMRSAVQQARALADVGVHKQWANRLIEPFSWHTVIVTATEWDNFYGLRCHADAQPEIRTIAEMMREAMASSKPRQVDHGDWHLPLVYPNGDDAGLPLEVLIELSVARCARVSYLTHDGKRDVEADRALYRRLLKSGHMSPFEHAAKPVALGRDFVGNFRGWIQHRKQIAGEACFRGES